MLGRIFRYTSSLLILSLIGVGLYLYFDVQSMPALVVTESSIVLDDSIDWESLQIEVVQNLENLISIQTVRKNENKAAFYLQKIFMKEGIPSKIIPHPHFPDKVSIIAELGPDNSTDGIILLSHTDVVEASAQDWNSDPFEGKLRDGFVRGRGALDMKGMIAMQLAAFLSLHRQQIPLKHKVMFLSVPDEESGGSKGAEFLLNEHADFFEGYSYVLNEGGFGIHDFPNHGNKLFTIQTAEKGILGLNIKSNSKSGHASMPESSYSTLNLMRFLLEAQSLQKFHLTPQAQVFFNQFSGLFNFPLNFLLQRLQNPIVAKLVSPKIRSNGSLNAMITNTISVTGLNVPNFGPNVIPSESESYLDVRLLPGVSADQVELQLQKIAKPYQISISRREYFPSTESSFETPLFGILTSIISDNVPDSISTVYLSPGATDSRFFRQKGFECYGLIPILISMEDLSKMHGKNEDISVENLRLGTKILLETLLAYNQLDFQ